MFKNSQFSGIFDSMFAQFVPQEEQDVRTTMQGNVVVLTQTPNGKEWVDAEANVYPEEFVLDFPVFSIAKHMDQVKVGDIVKLTKSTLAVVKEVKDGKVETLSFGGQHRQAKAFKNMLSGQATVRVITNLFNQQGDQNGNMLLLLSLLEKDSEDKNDFMKSMMMASVLSGNNQNPFGNMMQNPMALMMLMKDDRSSIQDIMMMQAFQGGFGGVVPTKKLEIAQVVEEVENQPE